MRYCSSAMMQVGITEKSMGCLLKWCWGVDGQEGQRGKMKKKRKNLPRPVRCQLLSLVFRSSTHQLQLTNSSTHSFTEHFCLRRLCLPFCFQDPLTLVSAFLGLPSPHHNSCLFFFFFAFAPRNFPARRYSLVICLKKKTKHGQQEPIRPFQPKRELAPKQKQPRALFHLSIHRYQEAWSIGSGTGIASLSLI